MLDSKSPVEEATKTLTAARSLDEEVKALHDRCGVYTKPEIVQRILDAIGWQSKTDLSEARLLEPAAGDGQFVVEAAKRLVQSYQGRGLHPTLRNLKHRITAYELHRGEAERARRRIVGALRELGVHHRTAAACAKSWIICADFLLADFRSKKFTHAVGNPPYIRWSRIPPSLKAKYDTQLPREMIGGDLFLPFLDRAFECLRPGGQCGFLCSDRWRFMAFAEGFRTKWLPRLDIDSEDSVAAIDAFVEDVDAYPTILIAKTRSKAKAVKAASSVEAGKTLGELGYVVKVGPALGHTPAFVLLPGEESVEPEVLRPWVDGSEIREGEVAWRGRHVIATYADDGKLIDPTLYPRLLEHLEGFRDILTTRSIVTNGATWFRTIDRVRAADWTRPKLLVPELAKVPRVAIDRSGAIPSHGVYAIFAPDDDVEALYKKLRNGKLAKALNKIAPKVKGGYVRCYRRFLNQIVLN